MLCRRTPDPGNSRLVPVCTGRDHFARLHHPHQLQKIQGSYLFNTTISNSHTFAVYKCQAHSNYYNIISIAMFHPTVVILNDMPYHISII